MTIIPRALVNHQLRCDIQDCHACGGDHVGLMFVKLPKPYGQWDRWATCPAIAKTFGKFLPDMNSVPVLMRESEAGPFGKDKDD